MNDEWPGPRERVPVGVPEQPALFPEVEETEQPTCYCCGEPAVGRTPLKEWGLAVDVCAECLDQLQFVVHDAPGRWKEGGLVCAVHGPIDALDCTDQEFTTEYRGRVTMRKSRAGRGVYPVKVEIVRR